MEERNQPRRPRRDAEQPQQKSESLIYGKNPVTELLIEREFSPSGLVDS